MALIYEFGDAADYSGTIYSMSIGDTFSGIIAYTYDRGWVKINLIAGDDMHITLDGLGLGTPLADPYLRVFDGSGVQVAFDDDGGLSGYNSALDFQALTTGAYYIQASAYDTEVGQYQISVTRNGLPPPPPPPPAPARPMPVGDPIPPAGALPVFTYDQIAEQLSHGYWEDYRGSTARSFNVGSDGSLNVNMTAMTFADQGLIRSALESWTNVTGIQFNFVSGSSEIFFTDNDPDGGAFSTPVSGVRSGTVRLAQVNVDTNFSYGTTVDTYRYQTFVHEIGHALGLGHGGNYNGSAYYNATYVGTNGNHYLNDSTLASIMSYMHPGTGTGNTVNPYVNADTAYSLTPQIADILAIQSLYGISTGQRTGNTTYGENSNAGGLYGQLAAYLRDTTNDIRLTIHDDGGTDTLDFGSDIFDQSISMFGGGVSQVYGLRGAVSISVNTVIENLIAGTGDDYVFGNGANNNISGGQGQDTIVDGFGSDTITGGAGWDVLASYSGTNSISGGTEHDLLIGGIGADDLSGGSGDDVLVGDVSHLFFGNDVLNGGTGNDKLFGGGGADEFHFGTNDGNDTIAAIDARPANVYFSSVTGADFVSGLDEVHLSGFGYGNGAQALTHVTDVGGHATFSDQGTTILFYGLTAADLAASDFFVL